MIFMGDRMHVEMLYDTCTSVQHSHIGVVIIGTLSFTSVSVMTTVAFAVLLQLSLAITSNV